MICNNRWVENILLKVAIRQIFDGWSYERIASQRRQWQAAQSLYVERRTVCQPACSNVPPNNSSRLSRFDQLSETAARHHRIRTTRGPDQSAGAQVIEVLIFAAEENARQCVPLIENCRTT